MAGKEIVLRDDDYIVSKTDLQGKIIYGDENFVRISGYTAEELMGKPHNMIRHEDMPKLVFKLLWERLKSGKEIFAFVKNKSKNGDYYWVFANVTPTKRGLSTINYHSVRRKPNPKAIVEISKLYGLILAEEKKGGITSSEKFLNNLLNEKGVTYDKFIADLQG